MSNAPRVVQVDIHGQRFPIRSSLDPQYVAELASYVDKKMRAAADAVPANDTFGLAVLVALNIADELFRCQEAQASESTTVTERARGLERLVDDALTLAR